MLVAFREGLSSSIPTWPRCSNRVLYTWNEFCVLQRPGLALWDLGSSQPSAILMAQGALELHRVLLGNCSLTV